MKKSGVFFCGTSESIISTLSYKHKEKCPNIKYPTRYLRHTDNGQTKKWKRNYISTPSFLYINSISYLERVNKYISKCFYLKNDIAHNQK